MKPKYSLVAFLPAVLVIILTMAAYTYLDKRETAQVRREFDHLGVGFASHLDYHIDHFQDLIEALSGFYDSSQEVTRDEFRDFVGRIKEPRDGIQAFEWIPLVRGNDRERYKAAARREGLAGYRITERNAEGRLVLAAQRPEYFPVYFIEPLEGNEAALGFDIASEPTRRLMMEKAWESGKATASFPLRLVQEKEGQAGVLVVKPVYARGPEVSAAGEGHRRLLGFVAGVLRVNDLMADTREGFSLSDLLIRLEDPAAPEQGRLIYANTPLNDPKAGHEKKDAQWETTIKVADRTWRLVMTPKQEFFAARRSMVAQVVLVSGVLIAALLQVIFLSMRRRTSEIEQNVIDRTKELKEEKEFSEAIINVLPAIFYLIDKDGRFVRWNKRLEGVTEYAADEIARMHPLDFFEGESKGYIAARITEVFEAGESFAEADLFTKSGKKILYFFTGTRLVTAHGEFLAGMGIDISERKLAEEERTRLQQQLQQAQKMEAIGQLTGGIAHDFNNILSSILGYTELVLDLYATDKEGKMAHYLRQVLSAGSRARDMVANMLAFSRGQRVKAGPLEMQPLVKEATVMLGSVLPSTVELVSRLDDELPHVVIDPVQLHQIVLNLCINARDALGGQGRIEVSLSKRNVSAVCSSCHQLAVGEYLALAVSDTGTGIPEDVLPRIFDPFFSTKEVGKGSGMGLAVVHGIVHEHNGHILVDSKPGSGTAFHLLFPCVAPVVPAEVIKDTGGEKTMSRCGHIMVVDDEEMVAKMMSELLKVHGYTVTAFTDSRQALERFRSSPSEFDAVVTDQTMPGVTGTELAKGILAVRPDLPIVLCTGYSDKVDAEAARQIGIRWFFLKPVAMGDLLSALRSVMPEVAP